MFIKQLYTGCLSESAYYIESEGIAAVIDPLRDIDEYLQLATERNATIKFIFETHFHADFISGHLDLAQATGATIIYGPDTVTKFPVHVAKDGEIFSIGKLTVEVMHTPGHTLESSCFLLKDEAGKDHAVFTGDTLFVGDVGRPDLSQKGAELTMEDLAGMLYDSLQTKIMPLADDVILYPAHGAGSSCGKNLGPETFSTIGAQKQSNYALQQQTKADFITAVTTGLSAPPQYFPINAKINKEGYDSLQSILDKGLQPLSIAAFKEKAAQDNTIILDTRKATVFTEGFVPNSIFIGLEGQFAPWVGALIPSVTQPIVLITSEGKEEETVQRLSRVGYDNVLGYLKGGIQAWDGELDAINRIEASQVEQGLGSDEVLIDVRKPGEYDAEHLADVPSIPLDYINERMVEFPKDKALVLHCAGGYRSMIAASILKARGYHHVKDVIGGFGALSKTSLPKTAYVCPSTLK